MKRWSRYALAAAAALACGGPGAAQEAEVSVDVLLRGRCAGLTAAGRDRSAGCAPRLMNIVFEDGMSSFLFNTPEMMVGFAGDRQVKLTPDDVVQNVDHVTIVRGEGDDDDVEIVEAVGRCRFRNPNLGPMTVLCTARTAQGTFRGESRYDGSTPEYSDGRDD